MHHFYMCKHVLQSAHSKEKTMDMGAGNLF